MNEQSALIEVQNYLDWAERDGHVYTDEGIDMDDNVIRGIARRLAYDVGLSRYIDELIEQFIEQAGFRVEEDA